MARLDFECPVDGCTARILNRVAPAGTPAPICLTHNRDMELLWVEGPAIDSFQSFSYEHDDGRVEQVDTLGRARQIERDAERATAGGYGRPAVFRHLSQDNTNRDRNVFADRHPQVAREKLLRKRRGKPIINVGGVDISVHGDPGAAGGTSGEE